jgi:hypothetical protein
MGNHALDDRGRALAIIDDRLLVILAYRDDQDRFVNTDSHVILLSVGCSLSVKLIPV